MRIFKDPDGKFKNLEGIVLCIEKHRDTIDWCNATIQSCLINIENPKAERWAINWCLSDLRENLNKKEEAVSKLEHLKYTKLRHEMFMLYMTGTPNTFLEDLDRLKEKKNINNLWKEQEYEKWREEVKKHPEKAGTLHITEDSFTFEFGKKNDKKKN